MDKYNFGLRWSRYDSCDTGSGLIEADYWALMEVRAQGVNLTVWLVWKLQFVLLSCIVLYGGVSIVLSTPFKLSSVE